jgi:hypothetical protein
MIKIGAVMKQELAVCISPLPIFQSLNQLKLNYTLCPESTSELYRQTERRLSAKLVLANFWG